MPPYTMPDQCVTFRAICLRLQREGVGKQSSISILDLDDRKEDLMVRTSTTAANQATRGFEIGSFQGLCPFSYALEPKRKCRA